MQVQHLDHFTLRTSRLAETQAFYAQVIGLTPGPRPAFAFSGVWLYARDQPLVHLAAFDPGDGALARYLGSRPGASEGSGCIDHISFRCVDLPAFERRLGDMRVGYERRTVPALQQHQLFLIDPDGVRIECIFDSSEAASWTVDAEGLAATSPAGTYPVRRLGERPLVLGQIALSFHVATAGVVRELLAQGGVAHAVVEDVHERIFESLATGRIDMVASAWMPGSHGAYVAPCRDDVIELGVLYEPHAIWGVPDYVPEDAVASLQDLARPAVAQRMTRLIQGIGPGAGISRFSREIVARYQLDELGYEFRNGSLDDCVHAFERAVAERRWVVVPLWHPQYLHRTHRIRALADPEGLLRGRDAATLLLRRDSAALLPPSVLSRLTRMTLGNSGATELDFLVSRERLDAREAARRWMAAHPRDVAAWG